MANKVYIQEETAKTWTDTGGDYALDLGSLAADGVRVGAQGDLGAAPRSPCAPTLTPSAARLPRSSA